MVMSRFRKLKKLKMSLQQWIFALMMIFFAGACSTPQERSETEKAATAEVKTLTIFVSNYPLKYFAERIAGPLAEVYFPAEGVGDPAYWSPTEEELAAMQQADLILLNGATYEPWLQSVSLPESRLLNTTASLEDRLIEIRQVVTHSHGDEGEHSHAGTAFTTWLDLSLAAGQARVIMEALTQRLPAAKTELQSRFSALQEDLMTLDTQLRDLTAGSELPVFFSHPVYQYLQQRYGINGRSVHWEPGLMPDRHAWDEFRHDLERHPARWMIWEAAPVAEMQRALAEMGLESVVFSPCADTPAKGDFLSAMQENIQRLRPVFSGNVQ